MQTQNMVFKLEQIKSNVEVDHELKSFDRISGPQMLTWQRQLIPPKRRCSRVDIVFDKEES